MRCSEAELRELGRTSSQSGALPPFSVRRTVREAAAVQPALDRLSEMRKRALALPCGATLAVLPRCSESMHARASILQPQTEGCPGPSVAAPSLGAPGPTCLLTRRPFQSRAARSTPSTHGRVNTTPKCSSLHLAILLLASRSSPRSCASAFPTRRASIAAATLSTSWAPHVGATA